MTQFGEKSAGTSGISQIWALMSEKRQLSKGIFHNTDGYEYFNKLAPLWKQPEPGLFNCWLHQRGDC